jgi:hypothetical protein
LQSSLPLKLFKSGFSVMPAWWLYSIRAIHRRPTYLKILMIILLEKL